MSIERQPLPEISSIPLIPEEIAVGIGEIALNSDPVELGNQLPAYGNRYAYRRSDVSMLSWALERTDLSDKDKPFFDF